MRATRAFTRVHVRAPLRPESLHSRNFRHSRHSRERPSTFGRTLRHRNASDRAEQNDSNHHRERLESVLSASFYSLFSVWKTKAKEEESFHQQRSLACLAIDLSFSPFCIDSKWIRDCDRKMKSCRLDGFRSTLLCPEDFPSPENRSFFPPLFLDLSLSLSSGCIDSQQIGRIDNHVKA